MSGYCSIPEARLLLGYTATDIGNTDLQELINYASTIIVEDLTISVIDEEPIGKIDGSNSTFTVMYYPLADVNADKVINSLDVTVYAWSIRDNPSTKTVVEVDTVYNREGYIVLKNPPSSSIQQITVDYAYTWEEALNWELLKLATAYMVGYIFAIRKFTVIPDVVSRGPLRFAHRVKPYDEYYKKYQEIMGYIMSKRHIRKTSDFQGLARIKMEQVSAPQ
jgi:hypothetical protein